MSENRKPINWDARLPEKMIQDCHRCNDFIVSDDKSEIVLFMLDHYGKDGIRNCTVPDEDVPGYPAGFSDD